MFVDQPITKVLKKKKFSKAFSFFIKSKCFLNSNDFEDKNECNPCFNRYTEKERKTFFLVKNYLKAMIM